MAMALNPYSTLHPGNKAIKYREHDTPEHLAAIDELAKHMYEISDDPSGSDPIEYLSPKDMEICERFVVEAKNAHWPNASLLDFRLYRDTPAAKAIRLNGRPAWSSPARIAKGGLTQALFFPKIEQHRGYIFGHLGIVPSQAVALCDDGKLRSLRGADLPSSKGIGWGILPKPALLMPALAPGHLQGVEYSNAGSLSLEATLKARMSG
jgi:hypothetical protein